MKLRYCSARASTLIWRRSTFWVRLSISSTSSGPLETVDIDDQRLGRQPRAHIDHAGFGFAMRPLDVSVPEALKLGFERGMSIASGGRRAARAASTRAAARAQGARPPPPTLRHVDRIAALQCRTTSQPAAIVAAARVAGLPDSASMPISSLISRPGKAQLFADQADHLGAFAWPGPSWPSAV